MESFVLALALTAASGHYTKPRQADQYRYIVSIHRSSKSHSFLCAGSLVASSWVLTAANCLPKSACKIGYDDVRNLDNGTYSKILKRIPHSSSRSVYSSTMGKNRLTPKSNNIGLALIEEVLKWPVGRISGVDYAAILGQQVTAFEFIFMPSTKSKIYQMNKKRFRATIMPKKKKFLFARFENDITTPDVKVLDVDTGLVILCQSKTGTGPNLCVANKCVDNEQTDPRSSALLPDYGAPLVHAGSIVGVTSEVEKYYSKHTPVSPYLDWIVHQITNKSLLRKYKTARHKLL